MSRFVRPSLVVISTVGLAAAFRIALLPLFPPDAPLLMIFILPIIASALWAGPYAGAVAAFLSAAVATSRFIPPIGSLPMATTAEVVRVTLFLAEGLLINWLVSRVASGNRDLLRAKARVEEASRAKDEFLAVLSHELRTPLNVILGYARMLGTQPVLLAGEASRFMAVIERNAVLLMRLVEDLLDVQRIERRQLVMERQTFDLAPLVTSVTQSLERVASAKRLEWRRCVPSIQVEGDPARLQQVVWNLLSNAVKFTPEEGRVSISAAARDGKVEIFVENTGAPISPEFLPRIFEPFQQGDMTPTRRHSGVGLGLWVVKNIVDLHHGAVRVDSNAARTLFTVMLPIRQGSTDEDSALARSSAGSP